MKKIGRPRIENKTKNGEQSFNRNYDKCITLRVLKEIPEKPIGYLRDRTSGDIIQTTDENGNINVSDFVLVYGKPAPKFGTQKESSEIKTHSIPKRF
tara:strand:+ start:616 stop:906 length:291 start_codon:yes stop_codon:yes gene_type:complete